jgi:2-methylcitrate dehydratase PrpD
VAQVHVTTIPFALRMADPGPATPLAAKFSVPWAVAAALVLGHAGLDAFTPVALGDARIRALARHVEVAADPGMSPRRPDYPTARVRVTLSDGRTLATAAGVPRGDADNPVDRQVVVDKFLALAGPRLGPRRAGDVVAAVQDLDRIKSLRDLTSLLSVNG